MKVKVYWEEYVAIFLFIVLFLVLAWQIVSRFLGVSNPWTSEVAQIIFIYISAFGASGIYLRNAHVRIELVENALPMIPRKVLRLLTQLLVLALLLYLCYFGVKITIRKSYLYLITIRISKAYMYAALPLFAAITGARALQGLIVELKTFSQQKDAV